MAKAQYPKTVGVPEDVQAEWEAYQAKHPESTFSGLVVKLLTEHFDNDNALA